MGICETVPGVVVLATHKRQSSETYILKVDYNGSAHIFLLPLVTNTYADTIREMRAAAGQKLVAERFILL